MSTKPTSYASYIAPFPAAQRAMLQKLRQTVLSTSPGLTECISYGLPAFSLGGKPLLAIGAARSHCSLYPMSPAALASLADDLRALSTSKGTIRFELDRPLPISLIRKIVRLRVKEHKSRAPSLAAKVPVAPKVGATRKAAAARTGPGKGAASQSVTELLATITHPHALAINATRRVILAADRRVIEAVKWNAPSFKIDEFFATIHLRAPSQCIQVILHHGAKPSTKQFAPPRLSEPDPRFGSLRHPDTTRCILTLPLSAGGRLSSGSRGVLTTLIQEWIAAERLAEA